jgi:hypothetical protein
MLATFTVDERLAQSNSQSTWPFSRYLGQVLRSEAGHVVPSAKLRTVAITGTLARLMNQLFRRRTQTAFGPANLWTGWTEYVNLCQKLRQRFS